MSVLCGLIGADGDVSACVVIVAGAANIGFVEDVECFSDETECNPLFEEDVFLEPEIERAKGAVEVDVCRYVLKLTTSKTWECCRAWRQSIPLVDESVELVAVFDLAAESVARGYGQARAAGSVDGGAGKKGVGRYARPIGVDGREGDLPWELRFAIESEAMCLVGDGISLLETRLVDSLDEIDLLVGVTVGELIVIGVVKRLRECVADVVLVADGTELSQADDQD